MKKLLFLIITSYQRVFSPDHGLLAVLFPYGFCKFYPTCSSYFGISIQKFGLFKGFLKGLGRLFRCHPWSKGGIDHP